MDVSPNVVIYPQCNSAAAFAALAHAHLFPDRRASTSDFISAFCFCAAEHKLFGNSLLFFFPAEWPSCLPTSFFTQPAVCVCVYKCKVCVYVRGSVRVKEDHSAWAEQCSGFLCSGVNRPFSPLSGTQRAVIYMEVMEWWRSGWNMCGRIMMRA